MGCSDYADCTKFLAIAAFSVQEMIGSHAQFIPVRRLQKHGVLQGSFASPSKATLLLN